MASLTSMEYAIQALNYFSPLVAFVYYFVAAVGSVVRLETERDGDHGKFRYAVLSTMAVIIATCACEAGLIISQPFNGSPLVTEASNIYALSSTLVWLVLLSSLANTAKQPWYPLCGFWIITFTAEISLISLYSIILQSPGKRAILQLTLHVIRAALTGMMPLWLGYKATFPSASRFEDVEAAPLLMHTQESSGVTQNSMPTSGYGSTETEDTQTTDELQRRAEEEKRNIDRIKYRLKREGNWWAYAKGFAVFIPFLWPSNKKKLQLNVVGLALCLVVFRVLSVLLPRQLGIVVDTLVQGKGRQSFVELAIYLLFCWLNSSAGIEGLRNWLWLPVEIDAHRSIATVAFNQVMGLSCDFHDGNQPEGVYAAVQQGKAVVELFESLLCNVLPMVLDLLIGCVYLTYLFGPYMALIATTTIVTYFWASAFFAQQQSSRQRIYSAACQRSFQVMCDTIGGWRTVAYFNRMAHMQKLYGASTAFSMKSERRYHVSYYYGYGLQTLIFDAGEAAACILAMYQIIYAGKSIGAFIFLMSYWQGLSGPLHSLSSANKRLLENLIDAEHLLELLRHRPTVADGPFQLDLDKGQVDFQHVKFSYDRKKQVINDLSFHVAPGQTVALIGETGGGKSTILKLLFRFYDVAGGGILIDGQDVRDVTLESLRENIGVVPQDPQLFNDTILANIRYARLDATDEEVIEACKAAAVHEKILTLANGYASRVGEHGIALSGGELQRIAIARAILKNPKIILLDEATSSVDSETEAKIQDALRRVCQNRTTFVAAHRLSTIIDADLILVIKDGAILEQGTPSDLLASKGKYYSLWSKEMGIFDAIKKQVDDLTEDRADSSESLAKGKRPASVARSNGVYGSYGKKAFRPDAPEFVPNYQRASLASNSVSEEAKPESPAPRQVLDNLEGNSVEKKPRSRKRKPKPDAGSVNSISLLDGSSEVLETPAVNSDSRSKTDQALIPKRPRYNRRHQVRSEPAGQGVTESQADVSSDRDGMPIGSIEGKPMARSARRVTAPSDPPSGPSTNTSKRRTRSRGLPNWKKNRNSSGTSSIAETRSSSGNVDWASDAPTLSMPPAAPFTSPAAGVTPSTGLAGSVSRAGVRFAPGF